MWHSPGVPPKQARLAVPCAQPSFLSPTLYCWPSGQVHQPPQPPTPSACSYWFVAGPLIGVVLALVVVTELEVLLVEGLVELVVLGVVVVEVVGVEVVVEEVVGLEVVVVEVVGLLEVVVVVEVVGAEVVTVEVLVLDVVVVEVVGLEVVVLVVLVVRVVVEVVVLSG